MHVENSSGSLQRSFRLCVLGSLLLGSCSEGSGTSSALDDSVETTGRLELFATDAPLDYDLVEEASLVFDQIEIHSDGTDGWLDLYDGDPFQIDISELRNGLTQQLVDLDLDVGTYDQLRLHAVGGRLELVNGNVYTVEDDTLRLGSLGTSGLKLHFTPEVTVAGGLTTSLLLDFDLAKMFKPIPGNAPLEATRFNIHPSIRVANLSESGEIRGSVVEDDGSGGLIGVDSASVYLMAPGETNTDNALTSTASETGGRYALMGVDPGTYDLIAEKITLDGTVIGVVVVAGNAITHDLEID
ncbi:MAG: hypothetical protein ACI841_000647 [Planctomycetota bacterium]|jgi:hypothetical protein